MSAPASNDTTDLRPWSEAAVRLLQGVVYPDDARVWDSVLLSRSTLESYFARIGLILVVDESEGFAFLRQMDDEEYADGCQPLPKLFRRTPLSYGATILCVLLRDYFRRFEDEDVDNERCVVETSVLLDDWKTFFPPDQDEVRLHRDLLTALRKLEELKFVRRFGEEPEAWEVRRILKARLPAAELESLKLKLLAASKGNE